MENQLGKSIIKSAWILCAAIIIGSFFIFSSRVKYTALSDDFYIDQSSGKIYITGQQYQNQNK